MPHLLNGLHRTRLTFVDKHQEHGDIFSFRFKPDRPVRHIAGQHAAFIVKGGGVHIFSLPSAPDEEFVMIGTHVRQGSRYKQALARLQPGDIITMYGPVLNFTLEDAPDSVVFLAQGIGITPFRSMLMQNAHQGNPISITLIHSDGIQPTYGSETQTLATVAHYPTNKEEFTTTLKSVIATNSAARFYLSGTRDFIKATKATLHQNCVSSDRVKTDDFWGY